MNLFVSNFIQVNILNLRKAVDIHRCENSKQSADPSVQTLQVQILCYVMPHGALLTMTWLQHIWDFTATISKSSSVSIEDIWPIFCFSWAPQITRHIHKCAKCYASFLTFHLWAPLSYHFFPLGSLKPHLDLTACLETVCCSRPKLPWKFKKLKKYF